MLDKHRGKDGKFITPKNHKDCHIRRKKKAEGPSLNWKTEKDREKQPMGVEEVLKKIAPIRFSLGTLSIT